MARTKTTPRKARPQVPTLGDTDVKTEETPKPGNDTQRKISSYFKVQFKATQKSKNVIAEKMSKISEKIAEELLVTETEKSQNSHIKQSTDESRNSHLEQSPNEVTETQTEDLSNTVTDQSQLQKKLATVIEQSNDKHKDEAPSTSQVVKLTCHLCNKTLSGLKSLKRHCNTIHNQKAIGYECPTCSYVCNRRDNYNKHLRNIHDYQQGEQLPVPKIINYKPKALAAKPIVSRPAEVRLDNFKPKFVIKPASPKYEPRTLKTNEVILNILEKKCDTMLNTSSTNTSILHISDEEMEQTSEAEPTLSFSNTSTYWREMLIADSKTLSTLAEDLYLSSSDSSINLSISDDNDDIDPDTIPWEQWTILDQWP